MTADRTRERPVHPAVVALESVSAEDTYAWMLGKFVLAMSEVDYALADAVAAVLGDQHAAALASWGKSGEQLQTQLEAAPSTQSLIPEYARLYGERNALVHGMYEGSSTPGLHGAIRLQASTRKNPSRYALEARTLDQGDLGRLLVDAESLRDRALHVIEAHRTA